MKIFIICSKAFYSETENIKNTLEGQGHIIELPNCYDKPETESVMKDLGEAEHKQFKKKMFKRSQSIVESCDAVLVLNFDKVKDNMVYKNYIGGATFLEMYDAFLADKKIYMYNEIPEGILHDEIYGFDPIILNGDIIKI